LRTDRDAAANGFKTVLDLAGWRASVLIYIAIVGQNAKWHSGRCEQAKTFTDDAAGRCDTFGWPYRIVRCFRDEIDESKVLAVAADNDSIADVRC
jgi:hypothetical protein